MVSGLHGDGTNSAHSTPLEPNAIASRLHLARFHAAREAAYGAFVILLSQPPDARTLQRLWPRLQDISTWLQGSGPVAPRWQAPAAMQPGGVPAGLGDGLICANPNCLRRQVGLRAAGLVGFERLQQDPLRDPCGVGEPWLPGADSRLLELMGLGRLAHRAAQALRNNDVARAAGATHFQAELIAHSRPCFDTLCGRLVRMQEDYYGRVACMLRWVLAQDAALMNVAGPE